MTTISRTFDPPITFDVDEKLVLKYEVEDIGNPIINGILVVLYDETGRMIAHRHLHHLIDKNAVLLEPIVFYEKAICYSLSVIFY